MRQPVVDGVEVGGAVGGAVGAPVPCAARPSTGFVHLDSPCRCFVGGPAPEFAAVVELSARRQSVGESWGWVYGFGFSSPLAPPARRTA